jgi:hypothetical protein
MKRGDRVQYTARFLRTVYCGKPHTNMTPICGFPPVETCKQTGIFLRLLPTYDGSLTTYAVVQWESPKRRRIVHLSAIAPLGHSRLFEVDDLPDLVALGMTPKLRPMATARGPAKTVVKLCTVGSARKFLCHCCFLTMRRKELEVNPEPWNECDVIDRGKDRTTRIEKRIRECEVVEVKCGRCGS